jgi:hypothetical protein
MKQYLLFAGTETIKTGGLHGFAGDFDTVTEAFLSLVDQQTASEWWHVLDTKTGEVYERRHIRMNNGMIGFQRSDWVVGTPAKKVPIAAPGAPKVAELSELEIGLRSVVANGVKAGNQANGSAADDKTVPGGAEVVDAFLGLDESAVDGQSISPGAKSIEQSTFAERPQRREWTWR